MLTETTAEALISELRSHQSDAEQRKIGRYFRGDGEIIGVRMRTVFDTAKAFSGMTIDEVERLLESRFYEARLGAVSIMDFQTRRRGLSEKDRRALYDLYLRRHDRIDNWDLVDRSAPRVVGWYLQDKPRDVLYDLARSSNVWERRTAMTATFWFIRQGDIDDTLEIARILQTDAEELINKSVGTGLRAASGVEQARVTKFLEEHAGTVPRVTLRYAVEKMPPNEKKRLLDLSASQRPK